MTSNQQETPLTQSTDLSKTIKITSCIETFLRTAESSFVYAQELVFSCCKNGSVLLLKLLLQLENPKKCLNSEYCWEGKWNFPLTLACTYGQYEICEVLLQFGANADLMTSKDLHTPLSIACFQGNEKIVKLLLSKRVKVNRTNAKGCTPLVAAIIGNHDSIVELLLHSGEEVINHNNRSYCFSPIFEAIASGSRTIVDLLLRARFNPNHFTDLLSSPLQYATHCGRIDIVDLLIKGGADPRYSHPKHEDGPPLIIALKSKREDIASLLLQSNVDVNVCHKGYTPLIIAIIRGYTNICKELIRLGARVEPTIDEAKNMSGTPLLSACESGKIEIVDLLLSKEAQLNRVSHRYTPLVYAINKRNFALFQHLIEKGAHVNPKFEEPIVTPIHATIITGNLEMFKALLSNGADLTQEVPSYLPPLIQILKNPKLIEFLEVALESKQFNIDSVGKSKIVPLVVSSSENQKDFCELLISAGADVNMKTPEGLTAIESAARNGNSEICKLLFDSGAEVTDDILVRIKEFDNTLAENMIHVIRKRREEEALKKVKQPNETRFDKFRRMMSIKPPKKRSNTKR